LLDNAKAIACDAPSLADATCRVAGWNSEPNGFGRQNPCPRRCTAGAQGFSFGVSPNEKRPAEVRESPSRPTVNAHHGVNMNQTTAEKTTRQDAAHRAAPPESSEGNTDVAGDEVAEALAAVGAFERTSPFSNMESDMRTLAEKLNVAADAIRQADREQRREAHLFAETLQLLQRAISPHLGEECSFESVDAEYHGAVLNVRAMCGYSGGRGDDPRGDAVKHLRTWAAQMHAAVGSIEQACGSTRGIELHEIHPLSREIICSELEGVRLMVDYTETPAEALAKAKQFVAGLQAAGVGG